MDFQNYQDIQPIPQNQQITYEPYYQPPPNNQVYPPQIYPSNSEPNQFYQNPQNQTPDNNEIYQQQQQIIQNNNQYELAQQPLIVPYEGNKLEIPFHKNYIFFSYMIISSLLIYLPVISVLTIFVPFVLIIEILLILYYGNNKIVIIKDESDSKIYINLVNYLSIKREKYVFPLDNISFNVILSKKKYILLFLNNLKNSIIETKVYSPAKFLYFFENINVNKFNGKDQLIGILNNFTKNKENPLNFNINAYMNNQQNNFINPNDFTKYIKINDRFFTFFKDDPLKTNHYLQCLFKGTSITIHIFLFLTSLVAFMSDMHDYDYDDKYYDEDEDDGIEYFLFMFMEYSFLYIFSFLIGLCICKCINSKKSLRIEIKYSFNFYKIFIGSLINDKNNYILTSEFFVNEIDRFILQKNQPNEDGFHLYVLLKGNVSREICYIKGQATELEGLLYILNERKVQIVGSNYNKVELQPLGECPPPTIY